MSAAELKVTTSAIPESRLAIHLEVPANRCLTSYEEAISRLSKSINLPGFRKGKVPRAVILQQVGMARVKASALEKLVEMAWKEALEKQQIMPLCEPELKDGFEALLEKFDPKESLVFTLETDIAPTPKLKSTKGLSALAEEIEFNDKKIDDLIEESRKQLATIVPISDRPASKGDIAVISFEGKFEDGTAIDGGSSESLDVELEKGKMIPGFVEGIVGMNLNDEKIIKCEFPKDYPQEEARGKKATFEVKLNDLKIRELPKLDNSFAKQASEKSTMKELRADLEKRLKEDHERKSLMSRQEALLKALIKELDVEIPKSMIDQEIRNMIEDTARRFAEQGMDVKSMFTQEIVNSLIKSSKSEAIENVKKSLALSALANQESINIKEDEVDKKFQEVIKDISTEKNIDENKLRDMIKEDLEKEKALEWLESNNTVEVQSKAKEIKTPKINSKKNGNLKKPTKT
tara:strand:+ start:19457 stop:20842 length:1386 start_codon:yes stop_codon:yes gene_type:complete